MIDLSTLTIKKCRDALDNKEFSSRELVQAHLESIRSKDGDVHAFLEVFDDALTQAEEADTKIGNKDKLPLLGIPVAVKDNMLVGGRHASAASKILQGFLSPRDGTAVRKLREAGAIILGRTNMDEFAMGSSTENSAYGPTRNPHDLSRVPGGSSGGSAAVVAAHMALGSYGSDTGGSIRQPAALCGVVGLKTTYGRVSRSGLIALASSLDQIGPFAKTTTDAEILYDAVRGLDPLDSTTIKEDTYPRRKKFEKKIGIPRKFVEDDALDKSIKENFARAVKRFEKLGYVLEDIDLPHMKYSLPAYYVILPAEASSNLARFDGVKYGLHKDGLDGVDDYLETRGAGFGREVRRRIILGTYVLSDGYYDAYYGSALETRRVIGREMREVFEKMDLVMTPTTLGPAFKLGEKTADPLKMYLEDVFTVTANIVGIPAISLPSGTVEKDNTSLPVGVQLMAGLGREDDLFLSGKEFMGEDL